MNGTIVLVRSLSYMFYETRRSSIQELLPFLFIVADRFWPNVTMQQYVKDNEFAIGGVLVARYKFAQI